jgi:hypothetical protein
MRNQVSFFCIVLILLELNDIKILEWIIECRSKEKAGLGSPRYSGWTLLCHSR